MSESDNEFVVRLDLDNWAEVVDSAKNGDMGPADEAREMLRSNRTPILNAMGKAGSEERREILRELLIESRLTEAALMDTIRTIADQKHAELMTELASTSNEIAGQSDVTARSLRNWTIVLAAATAVLAIATVVLVIATFQLE